MIKKSFRVKKALLLASVFVLCGMMLTSVDGCEENYFDQYELPDFENDSEKAARASGQAESGRRVSRQQQQPRQQQPGVRQPSESQPRPGQGAQPGSAQGTSRQTAPGAQASTGGTPSGQPGARQPSGNQSQTGQGAQGTQPGTSRQTSPGSQTGTPQGPQAIPGGTPARQSGGTPQPAVRSIGGKDWKLTELRKGSMLTVLNREKLEADGFGDLFTINFGERITGKAAPNRFMAPYEAGANNALTIQPLAGTLMASIPDPERIRERDYFQYIGSIKSWKLVQGRLELYSSDSAGKEVVLVYGN
ncbi:MAG: META domain-containing protein [Treponema sp.]|nr:META domain-containing protein [Treponema sp.]